jgi:hypothetical protein
MSPEMISETVSFEDACGVNDLLQTLAYLSNYPNDDAVFYQLYNDKGEIAGWRVEDKVTGEDLHL